MKGTRSNFLFIIHFVIFTFTYGTLWSMPTMQHHAARPSHWAQQALSHMSLREKLGQLFCVPISYQESGNESLATQKMLKFPYMNKAYVQNLVKKYHVGSIIFLRRLSVGEQLALTYDLQKLSALPLLVMEDLEWGLQMRLDNTIKFPRNLTLGAIQNEQLIYALGKEIGRQCSTMGVHMNLAPVVDVNNNAANPVINDRSFGENPRKVARCGQLFMQGLQNAGVKACAKHFPGHGNTVTDSHICLPTISSSARQLEATELYPFKRMIKAGVAAIMTAHLKIPALDTSALATTSRTIVTDILRKKLGFKGLVLTDALNMGAVAQYEPGEIELKALQAGHDILLVPMDLPKAIERLEIAVAQGELAEKEIDEHVLRILQAKEPYVRTQATGRKNATHVQAALHTPYALDLKKRLYQEALTMVKNNGAVPIAPRNPWAAVHIDGKENKFLHTLQKGAPGFTKMVSQQLAAPERKELLKKLAHYQTVVVGIDGMEKFANKNFGIRASTLALLQELHQQGNKVIAVIFGSPYSLRFFGKEDAIIVAYENDPDAQQAAAEAIIGSLKAKGKLPVTASAQFKIGAGIVQA